MKQKQSKGTWKKTRNWNVNYWKQKIYYMGNTLEKTNLKRELLNIKAGKFSEMAYIKIKSWQHVDLWDVEKYGAGYSSISHKRECIVRK